MKMDSWQLNSILEQKMSRAITSGKLTTILADRNSVPGGLDLSEFGEENFKRSLIHELKRIKVSDRPFLLVLVSLEKVSAGREGNNPRDRVFSTFVSSIRDTDVAGWYKNNSVLGIIYTEIGNAGDFAVKSIMERVQESLKSSLNDDEMEEVSVSVYLFPKEYGRVMYEFKAPRHPEPRRTSRAADHFVLDERCYH